MYAAYLKFVGHGASHDIGCRTRSKNSVSLDVYSTSLSPSKKPLFSGLSFLCGEKTTFAVCLRSDSEFRRPNFPSVLCWLLSPHLQHPYMQVPGLICHPFLRPNCCFKVTIQRDECQIDPWTDGYATLPGAPCYNGA